MAVVKKKDRLLLKALGVEVRKLKLKPDDTVVIRGPRSLLTGISEEILSEVAEVTECKVIIIDDRMDVSTLSSLTNGRKRTKNIAGARNG